VRANVELAKILGLGGFDLKRAVRTKPEFLEPEYPFEWTGIYRLKASAYQAWLFGGNDPSALLVAVPAPGVSTIDIRTVAEQSLRALSGPLSRQSPLALPGQVNVELDGQVILPLIVPSDGLWAISTEHQPEELNFSLRDIDGVEISPIEARRWKPAHEHEVSVRAICIETRKSVVLAQFNEWFTEVLQRFGPQLYRGKGVLRLAACRRSLIFQSVHMLIETAETRRAAEAEESTSFLVLIGRDLDEAVLRSGFERCLQ
jgi:hypothetical protein